MRNAGCPKSRMICASRALELPARRLPPFRCRHSSAGRCHEEPTTSPAVGRPHRNHRRRRFARHVSGHGKSTGLSTCPCRAGGWTSPETSRCHPLRRRPTIRAGPPPADPLVATRCGGWKQRSSRARRPTPRPRRSSPGCPRVRRAVSSSSPGIVPGQASKGMADRATLLVSRPPPFRHVGAPGILRRKPPRPSGAASRGPIPGPLPADRFVRPGGESRVDGASLENPGDRR